MHPKLSRMANGSTATTEAEGSEVTAETPPENRRDLGLVRLLLLLPVIAVCIPFFPGHMSADTLSQIGAARTGNISDHHTPILIWLWHAVWPLGLRPATVFVLQVVIFIPALYLILRGVFTRTWATLVTVAICFSPPVYGMLGYLSRDMWFTTTLLLAFGLLVRASQRPWATGRWYVLASLLSAFACLASRQNAAPAVLLVAVTAVGLWLSQRDSWDRWGNWRRRITVVTAGGALTVVLLGIQFTAITAINPATANPEQQLHIFDLAAISAREKENLLPGSVYPYRDWRPVAQAYSPDTAGTIIFTNPPLIPAVNSKEAVEDLRVNWLSAIRRHPLSYLDARVEVFLRQVSLTRPAVFVYHPVIDPNTEGQEIEFTELNDVATDYVEAFTINANLDGGVVHRVWLYLLLALAGMVILLRSASVPRRILGALAVSSVLYQVGLFFGAMGVQYRWQFGTVVIGLVVLAVLVRDGVAKVRRHRVA